MTTTKLGIRTESFALMTRIFAALRRTGRLVDMIWFQENAEYARAVLALADELHDPEVQEMVQRLRQQLQGFLTGTVKSVVVAPAPALAAGGYRASPLPAATQYASA